jgi:hypothetical protein
MTHFFGVSKYVPRQGVCLPNYSSFGLLFNAEVKGGKEIVGLTADVSANQAWQASSPIVCKKATLMQKKPLNCNRKHLVSYLGQVIQELLTVMVLPKRVSFSTFDGTTLNRDYFPVEKDNAPVIAMTQGVPYLGKTDTRRRTLN